VPPFAARYMEKYTRNQKARLGDDVYGIVNNCNDGTAETKIVPGHLEKIVGAYDKVTENVERRRAEVEEATELTKRMNEEH